MTTAGAANRTGSNYRVGEAISIASAKRFFDDRIVDDCGEGLPDSVTTAANYDFLDVSNSCPDLKGEGWSFHWAATDDSLSARK